MNLHSERVVEGSDTVVVIGSGPAGAAAALRLVKAGVKVLLLEAGTTAAAFGVTARLAGLTVLRLHRQMRARNGDLKVTGDPATVLYEDIAPGGLTNHWSCAVPRLSHDDFLDGRRAGEASTWPLQYEDLAPWYDWVEPLLCISGSPTGVPQLPAGKVRDIRSLAPVWQRIGTAAQADGQAVVPVPYVYGIRTTLTFSGTVFNSFVRLIKPILNAPNLAVRFGTRATQLEWSGRDKRVVAVIARDGATGADHRFPCRAVVVAAGSVNSTKLLLQSTSSDFPHGLGNTEDVLGRYLHDHPLGKLIVEMDRPLPFQPAAYVTRQSLAHTQPLYAASCLQWSGVYTLARSIVRGHPGRLRSTGFSLFGTMAPSPQNFVALDATARSSDGTPGLVLNIKYPPESEAALTSARDRMVALLEGEKLRPRVGLWVIDPVGSAIHYAGSCRMHASPKFGMLDAWSRLHAVRNVMVADSAAFTTGSEKNPVLTAMALAARGSQKLVDDLRAGNA
jgi:choline dehydrogenase-like flavoprotein